MSNEPPRHSEKAKQHIDKFRTSIDESSKSTSSMRAMPGDPPDTLPPSPMVTQAQLDLIPTILDTLVEAIEAMENAAADNGAMRADNVMTRSDLAASRDLSRRREKRIHASHIAMVLCMLAMTLGLWWRLDNVLGMIEAGGATPCKMHQSQTPRN